MPACRSRAQAGWSQDPAGQFSSPYLAMGNNWTNGTDPDGEWFGIDDAIAAIGGALYNVITNIGNINSVGSFFGYVSVGALSGEATLYGGPLAGGALLGLGNNLTQQISVNGWHNINWGQAALSTGIGAVTSYAGAALGQQIAPLASKALSGIASPVLRNAAIQGATGALGGFGIGTGVSLLQGNNIGTALKAGGQNALFGLGAGWTSGTALGLRESKALGLNPLTGRPKSYELPELSGRIGIRTEPQSLEEQLTLKEAQSGQGIEIMQNRINDPQYQGWMKMQHVHELPNGGKIVIHYWYNPLTGEMTGFKFKNFPLPKPSINIFPLNLK